MSKINYGFDSTEERYFYYWLVELYEIGMIDWIYSKRKTYRIVDEVKASRIIKMKTKSKTKSFILTKKRDYTPDFIFKFNDKAKGLLYYDKEEGYENRPYFYCNNNRGIIYLDIKGEFAGKLTSSITFPDRQSLMGHRFNIYVQKVIPFAKKVSKTTLFKSTFTPQKMIDEQVYSKTTVNRKTNKIKWRKGDSKIKYKVTKIKEFLC
tara:strand:- start:401 stop:1021 length:621 start_codon:yes stop_codon:yes gene_type:complete